jgi:hypothetical protein
MMHLETLLLVAPVIPFNIGVFVRAMWALTGRYVLKEPGKRREGRKREEERGRSA